MTEVEIDLWHFEQILREGIVVIPLNAEGRYIVRLLGSGDEVRMTVTTDEGPPHASKK